MNKNLKNRSGSLSNRGGRNENTGGNRQSGQPGAPQKANRQTKGNEERVPDGKEALKRGQIIFDKEIALQAIN